MPSPSVTIADIAEHASVSKATVSRVLNDPESVKPAKRQAVIEVMDRMNFRPNRFARGLASGKSMTIGVITQNIGTYYYDQIVRGIIHGLSTTAYSPIFSDGLFEKDAEGRAIETLRDRHVDGLILVGGDVPPEDLTTVGESIPLVVVARELDGWPGVCIAMDNTHVGYEVTRTLIAAGHRSVAHVMGNPAHPDAHRRLAGYQNALAESNIQYDPELVYQGNFYGQSGIMAVESWLSRGKHFSAIFAANDLTAQGVLLALSRRGIRVPDEVSVAGVDDKVESALMIPPLTTYRQPAQQMGKIASQKLLSLLDGQSVESLVVHGQMIQRESVGQIH